MRQPLLILFGLNPLVTFRFKNGKKSWYVLNSGINTNNKKFVYIKELGKDNFRLIFDKPERDVVYQDFCDGSPIYTRV